MKHKLFTRSKLVQEIIEEKSLEIDMCLVQLHDLIVALISYEGYKHNEIDAIINDYGCFEFCKQPLSIAMQRYLFEREERTKRLSGELYIDTKFIKMYIQHDNEIIKKQREVIWMQREKKLLIENQAILKENEKKRLKKKTNKLTG